ncbi:MAG: DEAD/DEAH box helicase [Chitinivibrionales bacterium]|nr:DEAD/DEAH box helicase [Chitinivibrionales bacterium]
MKKFKNLGLSDAMIANLTAKGFTEPTAIQETVIPAILNETNDIIAQAQTGTGKTAAFAIPIIERLEASIGSVQVLILTPTRELALQISREFESLDIGKKLSLLPVYGGQSMGLQLKALRQGVDIVVGTPGRVLDHLRRETLDIGQLSYLILDEADEMLNMGFAEDMEEIMRHTVGSKRTLLFSATMPQRIIDLSKAFMKNSRFIKTTKNLKASDLTEQIYFEVKQVDKFEALCRIVDIEHDFYGLIFCRTKADVDVLTKRLLERGYEAEALHGDIAQPQREAILGRFRAKLLTMLVATDVAARGIDIVNLTHVINYSLPYDIESYIHRIGRTGRAGNRGTAITFITPSEYRRLLQIQNTTRSVIRKAVIPDVKEIIKMKKARITEELEAIVSMGEDDRFGPWAEKLLAKYEARDLVAALMKYAFEEELDEGQYGELSRNAQGKPVVDTKGVSRLFISMGFIDDFNKRKIADLIETQAKIEPLDHSVIKVFERFSLVEVPFLSAEAIIEAFSRMPKKGSHHRLQVRLDKGPRQRKFVHRSEKKKKEKKGKKKDKKED